MLGFIKQKWYSRYGRVRFLLMDITCLVYTGLIGFLLLFFHKTVSNWPLHVLIHAAIVMVILEVIRWAEKSPHKKFLWIARTFYPIPLLLYGWEELEVLVPMIFGSCWATDLIVRMDKLLFGVHPTVWVQNLYTPWLNELMHLIYMSYYTLFLIPIFLYIRGRKKETFAVLSMVTLTYLSNYILFFLLPVLDPFHVPLIDQAMSTEHIGYFFVPINQFIQSTGGISVGAFPSSHVSGALVWVLSVFRYNRKIGFAYTPLVVSIGLSTVYTQLHHAVDPIFGYLWGIICFPIALKLIQIREEDPGVLP